MKAYCLALDKRKKEWLQLEQEALALGIDYENFVVGDGITLPKEEYDYIDDPNPDLSNWRYGNPKYKKNHYNAFMAHKIIIRRAKDAKLPYFLMLEDDAYFTARYTTIFDHLCKINPKFDIIYLGWWMGEETDEWNLKTEENYNTKGKISLLKATKHGGLHGAIIASSMYDFLLSLPPIDPIDSQLNNVHSQIQSYLLLPKIIHTKTMFSNCEGNVIERKYL